VPISGLGAIGTLVKLTDYHGTCELLLTREGFEPTYVRGERPWSEKFRHGIGIEEISHRYLFQDGDFPPSGAR